MPGIHTKKHRHTFLPQRDLYLRSLCLNGILWILNRTATHKAALFCKFILFSYCASLFLLWLLAVWQRYRPLHSGKNLRKSCLGIFRNCSTSKMAVTTWRNIPEDLYISTNSVGTLIFIFKRTSFSQNHYPQSALNNVDTVTWLAIPTHNYPYFGFALSTEPQFSVRPLQQYRQHNKINKSIFPDIFFLTQPRVNTRMYTCTHTENLKLYRHDASRGLQAVAFLQYIHSLGALRAKRRRTPHPTATTFTQWPHPVCGSQENGRFRTVVISTPQRSLSNFLLCVLQKGNSWLGLGLCIATV